MLKTLFISSISGIFFGFGFGCLYFVAQCVRAWVMGTPAFMVFVPILLLTSAAYFIAGYFLFKHR